MRRIFRAKTQRCLKFEWREERTQIELVCVFVRARHTIGSFVSLREMYTKPDLGDTF